MLKQQEKHGGDGDGGSLVTIKVVKAGRAFEVKGKKGQWLSEVLKKNGFDLKGLSVVYNGRTLKVNEQGELEEDVLLEEDATLQLAPERLTGGN